MMGGMLHRGRTILLCSVLAASALSMAGCEAIASIRGLIAVAGEVEEHLESDLKTELTDGKIDKVLEVLPELKTFSETAKVKWKPDPAAPDFQQLATALGGLADYMAFFESKDTRITEFYVDLIKIYDVQAFVALRKGQEESQKILEKEKEELEAKKAAASPEEVKKLDGELERNSLAQKKLAEATKAMEEAREQRKQQQQYTLSDAEIARVEARSKEIDEVFKASDVKSGS
jgi:hypothetical protein